MADSHVGPSLKRADVGDAAYLPDPIPAANVLVGDAPEVIRSIKFPEGDASVAVLPVAGSRLGLLLGFNATTGEIELMSPGSLLLAPNDVENFQLAQMATLTVKANITGSTADPADVPVASFVAVIPSFVGDSGAGGERGLVPAPITGDAAANRYLKADGTWSTVEAGVGVAAIFRMAGA